MVRVTLHHLVGGFKASIGDLYYRKLFILAVHVLTRDGRSISGQKEVDAGIGYYPWSVILSDLHSGLHQISGN